MDRLAAREAVETTNLPSAVLPDDVLADVLRRLAPRYLAACRYVCKAWREVIDARRLLRTELLPLSMGGIFINFHGNNHITGFFSRPSISRNLGLLPADGDTKDWHVRDHCNGLLLVTDHHMVHVQYVHNPATRWCAPLPPCPPHRVDKTTEVKYLVYDPTISLHYQVFSVPCFLYPYGDSDQAIERSEWPPSVYIIPVYSSRTGVWEERSFVREGEAAGTVADMRRSVGDEHHAVYWRGELYVHCQSDFVMRILLLTNKYQVIKPPRGIEVCNNYPQFHLGKSENGVYCASMVSSCRFRVWILNLMPCDNKMEWVLMYDSNIIEWLFSNEIGDSRQFQRKFLGPWILDDASYRYFRGWSDDPHDGDVIIEERSKWIQEASEGVKFDHNTDDGDKMYDSDDGMSVEKTGCISSPLADEKIARSFHSEDDVLHGKYYNGCLGILGFHPYKEILFLSESITRGLAYHLKSSKVQILGNLYPAGYYGDLIRNEQGIDESFIYTPCWLSDADSRQ